MIEYKNVVLNYQENTVLKNVNLKILDGEFMILVGPSGSGKTTMLKMINRLLEPSDGNIYMDALENISLIPEMKGWGKAEITQRTVELLDKVGLNAQEYMHRMPSELSGGEQQRIGIVRAMIGQPKILLMDEPFSALDAISRKQLQMLTKKLHKEFGMTTIFVTHDTDDALLLGDRIAVLQNGEICQVDQPENILKNPANEFVSNLFGGVSHA